jgi:hypothetical protein
LPLAGITPITGNAVASHEEGYGMDTTGDRFS